MLGGLRFDVSASSNPGRLMSTAGFFSRGRWKAVTPERKYRVATSLALADGSLGYDAFFDAVSRMDPNDLFVRDSFVKHVQKRGCTAGCLLHAKLCSVVMLAFGGILLVAAASFLIQNEIQGNSKGSLSCMRALTEHS